MGKNKPRTALHRKTNKLLAHIANNGGTKVECEWWDGGYPECMLPWSHKKECGCEGNPFKCKKLFYRYLASAKKPSTVIVEEFNRRETKEE